MENKKLTSLVVTSIFTALLTSELNHQMTFSDVSACEIANLDIEMRTCGQCNQPQPKPFGKINS